MDLFILIAITLVFSAFFSGMEIAFLTSNKLRIELESDQGVFSAKILSGFVRQPSRFIGTLLVGNNLAMVFYGIFMARLLEPILVGQFGLGEAWVLVLQTIISTLIILFAGEFVPKTIFQINSNFALSFFAIPLKLLYFILFLPMYITVGLSEFLIKIFLKIDTKRGEMAFGRVDLDNYVREITQETENEDVALNNELTILQNALDFSKVRARDCMVPRTEITAVSIDEDVQKVKSLFIESGFSKVLVYRENIDNIIGFINSNELFYNPDSIRRLIVPVIIIPETISAKEVLELFIKQNKSIAVVVDEFGGTSGILTIEDIIEEIFGDIEDEHDLEQFLEEKIDDNTYRFSARLDIDYINDTYRLQIPESDEYETLAGYIINHFEHIPEVNSQIQIDDYLFKVLEVTNVRIETVELHILQQKE